ncbi:MAG: argininosuccinate lyase [Omnitrophica bacterium RIFCSPHIGHO2_02_FULL_51_18]|nr:MAG: argininosuccinate lyase [Omnitrophica bacterium RIFCSPHIGHO2_02_FULL_51_18]
MTKKLWGGRFKKKTDSQFDAFSSSLRWDWRLLPYDLQIDRAHVKALVKCRVLKKSEAAKLLSALSKIEKRFQDPARIRRKAHEDVHSAVQEELAKFVGALADKIHTARSRNDLVSQSARLYCRDHALKILSMISELQTEVVKKAERYQQVLVPGMTHMQNAQALSQGHIFLAYAEMLERAKFRFQGALPFFDVCVLGSGALAGVTYDLDQKLIARELGLSCVTPNSYDVSGDRDFILNFLSCMLLLNLQISRISEDLMIGQTKGFSVVNVDQAFCTGSSMMPQKKNADFLELARGAAGVFAGNFVGFGMTLKALPTSYNRDLQWDKKYVFDSVETCEEILSIFIRMFKSLKINEEKARELLADETLYATDLADYLVKKGAAFGTAHHQVGRIVNFSEKNKTALSKIGLDILRHFAPKTEADVYELFDAKHSVRMKKTIGSTHPDQVKKQIQFWKMKLRNIRRL